MVIMIIQMKTMMKTTMMMMMQFRCYCPGDGDEQWINDESLFKELFKVTSHQDDTDGDCYSCDVCIHNCTESDFGYFKVDKHFVMWFSCQLRNEADYDGPNPLVVYKAPVPRFFPANNISVFLKNF